MVLLLSLYCILYHIVFLCYNDLFRDKNGGLHSLVIFNLYCPRNDPDRPERAEFKRNFNAMLEHQARNLVTKGYHVILAGDMNISHKRIDNCDPSEEFESAPERIWMSKLLDRSQSECQKWIITYGYDRFLVSNMN